MKNRDLIRNILFEEVDHEIENLMDYFTADKPLSDYTCEDLENLVKDEQIYSQQMFKFYYPKEHKLALDLDCYPFLFDLNANDFGDTNRRKIYIFKWENSQLDGRKKAYVGLAHDIYRRYKQHLKGTIEDKIKEHGPYTSFDVLDGYFDACGAQKQEKETIEKMEDDNYDIVNPDPESRSLGACKRNLEPYMKKLERVFYDKDIDFLKTEDPLLYGLLKKGEFHKIGTTRTPRPKNYCFKDLDTKKEYSSVTSLARDTGYKYATLRGNLLRFGEYKDRFLKLPISDCKKLNETFNLIGKILKEETTPDEIRKGIDISVDVLKQDYPFVVGWDYSDSPDKYTYKIYINLELDFSKAMEFYNLKPHPRYGKFIVGAIEYRETFPYPFSMMNYEDEGFDVEEVYKLQNDLTEIYEDIPNKLKMSQGSRAVFDQNKPKELAVDNYIFVR